MRNPLSDIATHGKTYALWLALVLVVNGGLLCLGEALYGREAPAVAWPARTSAFSGLLLLDTLLVVWWYAHCAAEQAATMRTQLHRQLQQWSIANKPVVFLDVVRDPSRADDRHYVVRNVGPGLAVNVFLVEPGTPPTTVTVGSLASGEELPVPSANARPLRDHEGQCPARLVLTEAMATRTQQWIVTCNVVDQVGSVRHRFSTFESDGTLTLADVLGQHGPRFFRELEALRREVVRK